MVGGAFQAEGTTNAEALRQELFRNSEEPSMMRTERARG